MLFRVLSLVIAFTVLIQSSITYAHQGLSEAFDELNYGLTVEWDQQDKAFYEAQVKKFQYALTSLKDSGLSQQELKLFLATQVKNEHFVHDLESAMAELDLSKMTDAEILNHLQQIALKSYSSGASWNGEAAHYAFVAVVVVAFFTGMIYFHSTFHNK